MSGDLFTVPYAVWLNQRVESGPAEIEAAVTATAAAYKEDLKYQATAHKADLRVVKIERDFYKSQADREFYEEPAFWMVVTAAAFVGGLLAGREFVKVESSVSP